jgi:hypothetical protein
MQNKLVDLNNHLFAAMERLNDENLSPEALQIEISRSKAMTNIAQAIIQNGNLALKTVKHVNEYRTDGRETAIPTMLLGEEKATQ